MLSVVCNKGHVHDFKIFEESQLSIPDEVQKRVDLGYQGIQKLHNNVAIPHKKPKGGSLSAEQKKENRQLAKARIPIEHVNRRCKIFRIAKENFRGKHKNFCKTWNLIAGLVNFRYSDSASFI